jgi:esterase/lipase
MSLLRMLLASLSGADELDTRHRPSGINSTMPPAATLDEYLAECRRRVTEARTDLDSAARETIIDGNAPFLLRPDRPGTPRRAILLLHGLSDSAFLVRDVGRWFQQQGFVVLGALLPGHGTRPGDMREVRWQTWLDTPRRLVALLRREADEIYLLGFSAGATLALHHTLLHGGIKALFLFAPAVRVRRLAWVACPLARLGRWFRRLAWFDVQPDGDCFKYESLATHAICEVLAMIRALNRLQSLRMLDVPVFVAASENDATIDSAAILDWFDALPHRHKRMLWYSTGQPRVPPKVKVVNSVFAGRNIRSFAHTALLQSPDNLHYGEHGRQRVCIHYYRLAPYKYRRCHEGDEDCLGEVFEETPDCEVVRRLTWNPVFEGMLGEMKVFLDEMDEVGGLK